MHYFEAYRSTKVTARSFSGKDGWARFFMDNHPIPQDVTGFQFRLIGNMTVKQFAYVAVGAVGAVVIYYLPFFLVLKIVFIPLFILSGVGLAFLPIEGRPIDIMMTHFLKAILSPTQFMYQKQGGHLLLSSIHIDQKAANQAAAAQVAGKDIPTHTQEQRHAERRQQLSSYLASIHQNQAIDDKEATRLSSLFGTTPVATPAPVTPEIVSPAPVALSEPTAVVTQPIPVVETVQPTPEPTPVAPVETLPADTMILMQKDQEKIAEDETLIQQVNEELTRAKAAEQGVAGAETSTAHLKTQELEKKLQDIMAAKQQLEEEILSLKAKPATKIVSTPQIPSMPQQPAATVAVAAPTQPADPNAPISKTAGFPSIPDTANMLLGVVRDSSGNVLPHILVEVKDKDENPVRAFKTNQLGQFLSATPLKEGTYTVSFEDTKNSYQFDPITVVVNNQILQPVEIAAHDLREELRKSLFA